MAWQRSTSIHAGRPSPIAAMLGVMQGGSKSEAKHGNVKSQATAQPPRSARRLAFDSAVAVDFAPLSAPRIAGHGGQAPKEARQEPKPFRRATDGASKSPVMAEKHRASVRAVASREPTQRRERPSFGYFPWVFQGKVTRAIARNSALRSAKENKG